jgi:hypothetical protein
MAGRRSTQVGKFVQSGVNQILIVRSTWSDNMTIALSLP